MTGKSITIQEFSDTYGAKPLFTRWMLEKDVSDFLGMQITGGVILADALIGDGMRDHISPELLEGFRALMGEKADTADEIRDILVEKLMLGDASVLGLINKIKGQVGENLFAETAANAGFSARLAEAGNQEAWDCCVTGSDGVAQYVQVKTYASADAVVEKMKEVAEKVSAGKITDGDKAVDAISFAVPQDIYGDVVSKAQAAGLDTPIIPFDLSAQDAARIVQEGFDNVAYHGFGNFFNELAGGTLTATVLHTLVQAFLLHKGASENTMRNIARETGLSAGGIGAALGMEGVVVKGLGLATGSLPAVALLIATGMTARGLLRRIVARHDYAGFLRQENALLEQRLLAFRAK